MNSDRIVIDRSANHCHLTEADAKAIFGEDVNPTLTRPLAIKGEFVTNLKIELHTNKIPSECTVLYPWRTYSQIELCASDYYKIFGEYPQRRKSGDLQGAKTIRVICPKPSIYIPVIVPRAHIHLERVSDIWLLHDLNIPFRIPVQDAETTDGLSHIHLDADQYAALQGI